MIFGLKYATEIIKRIMEVQTMRLEGIKKIVKITFLT